MCKYFSGPDNEGIADTNVLSQFVTTLTCFALHSRQASFLLKTAQLDKLARETLTYNVEGDQFLVCCVQNTARRYRGVKENKRKYLDCKDGLVCSK